MTNSKACGCNDSSVGQWTRVQIPGIQMSHGAKSSPSSAKTPFSSMQSWVGDALGWLFQAFHSPCAGACGGEQGGPGCGYGEGGPGNNNFLTVCPSSTAQPLVATHLYGLYPTLGPVSTLVRSGTWGKEGRGIALITSKLGRGEITQRVACSCGECPAWPRSRCCLCLIVVRILNLHHTRFNLRSAPTCHTDHPSAWPLVNKTLLQHPTLRAVPRACWRCTSPFQTAAAFKGSSLVHPLLITRAGRGQLSHASE